MALQPGFEPCNDPDLYNYYFTTPTLCSLQWQRAIDALKHSTGEHFSRNSVAQLKSRPTSAIAPVFLAPQPHPSQSQSVGPPSHTHPFYTLAVLVLIFDALRRMRRMEQFEDTAGADATRSAPPPIRIFFVAASPSINLNGRFSEMQSDFVRPSVRSSVRPSVRPATVLAVRLCTEYFVVYLIRHLSISRAAAVGQTVGGGGARIDQPMTLSVVSASFVSVS